MAEIASVQLNKDLERYTELAKVNAVTQQQLEQIRLQAEGAATKMNSLKQRLNDYLIKAPLGGVINQLFVSRGNATGMGTPVCEIVGSSFVKIEAKLNPDQAENLQIGLKATIIDEFGHGENYKAFLSELGQKAGKFGGVAAVFRMEPGQKNMPSAGSLVNIRINMKGNPKLLLPRQALTYTGDRTGLFVLLQDKTVEFTPVAYIDFDDKYITILDTTLANRQIVVEGNYMLETGDLVKVIL
jgi:RND family efflux transporter MFP subunit